MKQIAGTTTIRRRAVLIAGHRTSVSVEDAFWAAFKEIAAEDGTSLNRMITDIDEARSSNLSSAIRVFVLERLRAKLAACVTRENRASRG